MGTYSDMLAERKKARPAEEKASAERKALSRKAFEESGASRKVKEVKKPEPQKSAPGSLSGASKRKLLAGEGIWK